MAKLSAKELRVVTNSIFEKVEVKKEQFKLTQEYLDIETIVKDEIKYSDLLSLITDYEHINNQISDLQNQKNLIGLQINLLKVKNFSNPHNINSLNNIVKSKANIILQNNFPSKEKIEEEIILLSLSGNNDIINTILNKFNLL
jgi:hypothetical protein